MDKKHSKIRKDFNFSQIGISSRKQYLYLIDKKKHLRNVIKKKKKPNYEGLEGDDEDLYEKDEYGEDIFDINYKNKYIDILDEQKEKYLSLKKSCTFISDIDEKNLDRKLHKEKFRYHLIHHNVDYRDDTKLIRKKKENEGPSSSSYHPKMEYVFKKLIYSPQFHKMCGRYDYDILRSQIEEKIDINQKEKKEKEHKRFLRRKEKIKEAMELNAERKNADDASKNSKRGTMVKSNSMVNALSKDNSSLEPARGGDTRNRGKIIKRRISQNESKQDKFLSVLYGNKYKNMMENIKEDENEDKYDNMNKNSSNNIDDNTLSSLGRHKTLSAKKKETIYKTNKSEVDIIYPYSISKNESNLLINNNTNNNTPSLKNQGSILLLNKTNILQNKSISASKEGKNSKIQKNKRNKESVTNSANNSTMNILPKILNKKTVNFDKMISREQLRKLHAVKKQKIYTDLTPKYDYIKPKIIMKVTYNNHIKCKRYKGKDFKSSFNEMIYDADKCINNYNNHFPPKTVYLDKISGRDINNSSPLPMYLQNLTNRVSFNIFDQKSYQMNNYALGKFSEVKSSFNDKKSFNYKLNEQYMRPKDDNQIMNYNQKLFNKLPEYYKINLDNVGRYQNSPGNKIDGFTLKTIKTNKSAINLLSQHEKNIFLSSLDENNV